MSQESSRVCPRHSKALEKHFIIGEGIVYTCPRKCSYRENKDGERI